jgi:hypothetical protein
VTNQAIRQHTRGQIESSRSQLPRRGQGPYLHVVQAQSCLDRWENYRENLLEPVDDRVAAGHNSEQPQTFGAEITYF